MNYLIPDKAVVLKEAFHYHAGMAKLGCQAPYAHGVVSTVREDPAIASACYPEMNIKKAAQSGLNIPIIRLDLCYQTDPDIIS